MRIETGKGTISLLTLISVWSISAMISLPGLAVSPILGSLTKIFPHATDIDIQMLSSVPSLMIIPFIIISGYLATGYDKVKILVIGLVIYIGSGAACIFAKSITALTILSTVLGIGAGMIIPLSTGFMAQLFSGKYRTAQLGISSAIANLSLVVATFLTGWLAQVDWHLPFVVYLFPILTLALSPFLDESRRTLMKEHDPSHPEPAAKKIGLGAGGGKSTQRTSQSPTMTLTVSGKAATVDEAPYKTAVTPAADPAEDAPPHVKPGKKFDLKTLAGIMLLYFAAGYAALTVIFNLPFVILDHKLDSSVTGTLTALFYLAIMTPGFFMNRIKSLVGHYSVTVSMLLISIGLTVIFLSPRVVLIGLGVALTGLGYGFIQPFVYDKATQASLPGKSIIALAYVMAVNYLTIVAAPFIIHGLARLLGFASDVTPSFLISSVVALSVAVWAAVRNRHFVFSI